MFKIANDYEFIILKLLALLFYVRWTRTKSSSELDSPESNGTANHEEKIHFIVPPLLIRPELGGLTKKNWTYLSNEVNNL